MKEIDIYKVIYFNLHWNIFWYDAVLLQHCYVWYLRDALYFCSVFPSDEMPKLEMPDGHFLGWSNVYRLFVIGPGWVDRISRITWLHRHCDKQNVNFDVTQSFSLKKQSPMNLWLFQMSHKITVSNTTWAWKILNPVVNAKTELIINKFSRLLKSLSHVLYVCPIVEISFKIPGTALRGPLWWRPCNER